jgi:hypothetical protein
MTLPSVQLLAVIRAIGTNRNRSFTVKEVEAMTMGKVAHAGDAGNGKEETPSG